MKHLTTAVRSATVTGAFLLLSVLPPMGGAEKACAAEDPCQTALQAAIEACEAARDELESADSLEEVIDALDAVEFCIDQANVVIKHCSS
ncbi:MAG: hypothetical protein OXI76_01735 [Gemmatimonadota bacterium]|nr:hypothetical protein [Gemmatimonadota bacterium]